MPATTPDAGTVKPVDPKPVDPKPVDPPKIEKVQVLVDSNPDKADIIGPDGKKIGVTPDTVTVESGKPLELTLRKKRHKDRVITIDGAQRKVSFPLEKKAGAVTRPPRDACTKDPASQACQCMKNPGLPECQLE